MDGDVKGSSLEELFQSRAAFMSSLDAECSIEDYYEKSASEIRKIPEINSDSDINLWFEDDLFCQVNFWFVAHLLSKTHQNNPIFLVRPNTHNQYGFGGLNKPQLVEIYENRLAITHLDKLAKLWEAYQNNDITKLTDTAKELNKDYPFILPAVEAHRERIPANGKQGRPTQSLIQIIDELGTQEFGPVFREFCKRESIYGFGDLQVKKLFDEIVSNN